VVQNALALLRTAYPVSSRPGLTARNPKKISCQAVGGKIQRSTEDREKTLILHLCNGPQLIETFCCAPLSQAESAAGCFILHD
jgi:hypothetical protein